MAHFALLDEDNTVLRVEAVHDDEAPTEAAGVAFLQSLYGDETRWVQTSYNATMRQNFAGVGFVFDTGRDAFIAPKPFQSWVLDEACCQWVAPVKVPANGGKLEWDETAKNWTATREGLVTSERERAAAPDAQTPDAAADL